MARITYVAANGDEQTVEAAAGQNLMEAAVKNGVVGIVGLCGGSCACGTCRVYVPVEWLAVTGEPSDMESGMLEFVEEQDPTARLGCQIVVTEQFDGLTVRMPEAQQ